MWSYGLMDIYPTRGHRDQDRMVVGFKTTYMYTTSCNNVAPVTNLCLGRATMWPHSSQWSKKKVAVET